MRDISEYVWAVLTAGAFFVLFLYFSAFNVGTVKDKGPYIVRDRGTIHDK